MWKEKYKLGVPLIDTQHKELFSRVTDFVKALRSPGEWSDKLTVVNSTMAFMQEYVVTHFDAEEAYQKEIQYPGFDFHHKIHEDFKEEVNAFAVKFSQDASEDLAQAFAGKLLAWLINHVAATDLKIAEFALSKESDN